MQTTTLRIIIDDLNIIKDQTLQNEKDIKRQEALSIDIESRLSKAIADLDKDLLKKSLYDQDNDGVIDNAFTAHRAATIYDPTGANPPMTTNDMYQAYNKIHNLEAKVNTKEDSLGTPSKDDQILSSKTDGTKSWIDLPTGSVPGNVLLADGSVKVEETLTIGDRSGTAHLELDSNKTAANKVVFKRNGTALSSIGNITTANDRLVIEQRAQDDIQFLLPKDQNIVASIGGEFQIVQTTKNGTTALRPNAEIGTMYFDTTLNKPIWFNGTDWVDATGAKV